MLSNFEGKMVLAKGMGSLSLHIQISLRLSPGPLLHTPPKLSFSVWRLARCQPYLISMDTCVLIVCLDILFMIFANSFLPMPCGLNSASVLIKTHICKSSSLGTHSPGMLL